MQYEVSSGAVVFIRKDNDIWGSNECFSIWEFEKNTESSERVH